MPANNKKVDLAQVFKDTEEKWQQPTEKTDTQSTSTHPHTPKIEPTVPTARENKKHIGGYFDEAVYKQMKHIGIEMGMTTQQILADALNRFFTHHDKPPIA